MTRLWKVGELARSTGLSVRTLHHYDEIGLLSPSHRTPSGHRQYAEGDVARLQQIVSLRSLGLPLEEIRGALDRRGLSLAEVVRLHAARLREQLECSAGWSSAWRRSPPGWTGRRASPPRN